MKGPNLYGLDMFGEPVAPPVRGKIAGEFVVPPMTLLSSREGWWQERKRLWIGFGIDGEVGRDAKSYQVQDWTSERIETGLCSKTIGNGTSVFDPVLTELVYRWYCPDGGMILDPFAGGSVRGIVAAMMGRRYHGIELRAEQVEANRVQAAAICPESCGIAIRVSGPSLRQMFHPCEPDYITNVCHAACGCRGSSSEPAKRLGGICVTVHPSEVVHITNLGATVRDGFIVPTDRGTCPFNNPATSLCDVHFKGKPFGCGASPFTLNDNDTLIVRNRYRLLKCYKADGAVPAYDAHRFALTTIFGESEAARIAGEAAGGADVIAATIAVDAYGRLKDNDDAKHGASSSRRRSALTWICGDSREELADAPAADLIFSCPPYADLERYSDDPRDLSAMEWPAFLAAYREIIAKSCARLAPDRFACFVVGDVRDKDGFYRNLPGETIRAFADAGCRLYNEAILATPVGSLPIRVGKQFRVSRKMGKTHQNIYVFIKGCPRRASAAIPLGDVV